MKSSKVWLKLWTILDMELIKSFGILNRKGERESFIENFFVYCATTTDCEQKTACLNFLPRLRVLASLFNVAIRNFLDKKTAFILDSYKHKLIKKSRWILIGFDTSYRRLRAERERKEIPRSFAV